MHKKMKKMESYYTDPTHDSYFNLYLLTHVIKQTTVV